MVHATSMTRNHHLKLKSLSQYTKHLGLRNNRQSFASYQQIPDLPQQTTTINLEPDKWGRALS